MVTLDDKNRKKTPQPMRPQPNPAPAPAAITPADIWRIIRRRQWVIVITAAILIVPGIALNIAWAKWWPKWPGVAFLRVDSPVIRDTMSRQEMAAPQALEMYARAEARRIRSPEYAAKVLENKDVRGTAWYKSFKDGTQAAIEFEKTLSVSAQRESSLIKVSFETRVPNDAPLIVNVLVSDVYLLDRQKEGRLELEGRLKRLKGLREGLESDRRLQATAINSHMKEYKIPLLIGKRTEVDDKLRQLVLTYDQTDLANESAKAALENMRKHKSPATWIPDPMSQNRIDGDPTVRTLSQTLLSLREELEMRSKMFGQDHLFIKQLDDRIRISGRDLKSKRTELKGQLFMEGLNGITQAVEVNEKILTQLDEDIKEIHAEQDKRIPRILEYNNMRENKNRLTGLINGLEEEINRTQATLNDVKIKETRVSLVYPARQAPRRSSPNLKMNLAITLVLSVMAGGGLAFLLEFMDKSVRSSQDIRRYTSLNLLGMVPALEEDEANPEDMYSVITQAPRSLLAEAFRQIRTNIMFSCGKENCRSMLITSVSPDDGRTCIAVNIAASIAQSGKKVLLIDANFRKPALKRLFPNLPEEGFAELLSGEISIEQAIVQSDTPGLWVMGNGQAPAHHSRILGSSTLTGVIEKLSNQFDQVILDGPPALLHADVLAMSGQVGGVVFVARAGKNSRGEINRMRDDISKLNTHIHGVVLNAVEAVGGGYLRERYRLFYDYQEQESLPEPEPEPEVPSQTQA